MSVLKSVLRPITSGVLKAILSESQRYFTTLVASGSMHYTIPVFTLTGDFDITWEFYTSEDPSFQMVLGNSASNSTFLAIIGGRSIRISGNSGNTTSSDAGVYNLNKLNIARVVRDGSTITFSVNGAPAGSGVNTDDFTFDLIGKYGGGLFFDGILANGSIIDAGTLIRFYKINENLANGSAIIDSSGNGQNGVAINITSPDLFTLQSNGNYLGVDIITNGNFTTDTDWTKSSQVSISGGQAHLISTDGSFQDFSQIITDAAQGDVYQATINQAAVTSGLAKVAWAGDASPTANQIFPGTAGEHSVIWMHNGSAANDLSLGRAGGVTDIDINSLRLERILERA